MATKKLVDKINRQYRKEFKDFEKRMKKQGGKKNGSKRSN